MLEPSEAWKAASTKRAILSKPIVDLNTGVKSILCMSCSSFKSKVDKFGLPLWPNRFSYVTSKRAVTEHIVCRNKITRSGGKNLIFKIYTKTSEAFVELCNTPLFSIMRLWPVQLDVS